MRRLLLFCVLPILLLCCDVSNQNKQTVTLENDSPYDVEFKFSLISDDTVYSLPANTSMVIDTYRPIKIEIINYVPVHTFFDSASEIHFIEDKQVEITFVNYTNKTVKCSTEDNRDPILVEPKSEKVIKLYQNKLTFKLLSDNEGIEMQYSPSTSRVLFF